MEQKILILLTLAILVVIPTTLDANAENTSQTYDDILEEILGEVYSDDSETKCIDGEVLIQRINNKDFICIDEITAKRWLEIGIASSYETSTEEEKKFETINAYISGGELTEPIFINTFSRFQSGMDLTVINSLRELGYEHYFFLESMPSKDKTEFYNLISKYINPGKVPTPFDISLDTTTNEGYTVGVTTFRNCDVKEFGNYLQEYRNVFQFSNKDGNEIRDRILFYCGGSIFEVGDQGFTTVDFDDDMLNENNRVMRFVVHFYNGDLEDVETFYSFQNFSPAVNTDDNP